MADLKTILKATLLGAVSENSQSAMSPLPASLIPPEPNTAFFSLDELKPIWHYSYVQGNYEQISELTCRVSSMGFMEMPVAKEITWGPVQVRHLGIDYPLPLKKTYLMQTNFLETGLLHGNKSALWPLAARTDKSFEHVFGYEVPLTGGLRAIPAAVYNSDDFMTPCAEGSAATAAAGELCTLTVVPLRIVVVVSFVCCKERADFEPGGVVGTGRIYPLVMVMANRPLDAMSAEVSLARPENTPHTEMNGDTMLPPLAASLFAERNDSVFPPNFWDWYFSHYLIDPPNTSYVLVDPALPARHISGAVRACGAHYFQTLPFPGANSEIKLPSKDNPFDKVAGQGAFDNLHIAPRMVAPAHILKAHPGEHSLNQIAMAPICAHDCLHMHWRWSSSYGKQHNYGWDATGPYRVAGAPMVPTNQKVVLTMTSPRSFKYRAEVSTKIPPCQWQVVFHHGAAYALSLSFVGERLTDAQGGQLWLSNESQIGGTGWAMWYWRMRYRYDWAGVQERITVTDHAKAQS